MKKTTKAWINLVTLAVTLAINTLGATGVINGLSQKEVSDRFPTLITPGPSTFSIWGVIYGLLILGAIVLIVKNNDAYYGRIQDGTGPLFWVSCALNIAWIVTFSYLLFELSVLFILALTVTLALICKRLLALNGHRRWLFPIAFGLYTGWLFIASVVNVSAMLVKLGWNGFGLSQETWAAVILAGAAALVVLVMMSLRNAAFPLPVAWAYLGIYMNPASPDGLLTLNGTARTFSLIGIIVLLAAAAVRFYMNRFSVLPLYTSEPLHSGKK
ncbi:MAG: tryptophan-rich sensory protein [Eubacteriales bacterium]|nr:tryptophan-rich sensory protein [Eubacteriales bacterium]